MNLDLNKLLILCIFVSSSQLFADDSFILNYEDVDIKKVTQDKDEAIESDLLKDQHPSMPINAERQTRVTFGGTKKD